MTKHDLVERGVAWGKIHVKEQPVFITTVLSNGKLIVKNRAVEIKNFDKAWVSTINNSEGIYLFENDCPRTFRMAFVDENTIVDPKIKRKDFEDFYDNQ